MVKVTMKSKKNGASSLFLVEDRTSSESTKKATEKKRGRTRVLQVKSPPKTKGATKPKAKPKKKAKKQDANMPKKPPTAFFYFLEDFRKEFQEQNPGVKSMRDIGKACGEKWKTMTYEEKVQYYDIATEKKKPNLRRPCKSFSRERKEVRIKKVILRIQIIEFVGQVENGQSRILKALMDMYIIFIGHKCL